MYWRLLLLVVGALAYDWKMYDGHKIVQFTPKNAQQLKVVKDFSSGEGVIALNDLVAGKRAEFLVSHDKFGLLKSTLYKNGMTFEVSNNDFGADLKKEWERMLARGYPETMVYDINDFNTLADIEAEMDNLASQCASVGLSCSTEYLPGPPLHEGHQIKIIHVINPNGAHKNSILWESLIHAREWLAGATLMNILDKMIKEYGTDADVTRYLDNYDFHFIPIMNPDGYQHSWDDDRMWRKNRRNNEGSLCFGVDLNRNWDSNWGGPGASDNPCDETYHGPSAASEPETQTVVDYVTGNADPAWLVDVSFHTYGQYVLVPYGDCTLPPNWDTGLSEVVRLMCLAIENTYNTRWDCGNSCEVLYITSGGSTDWMMETAGMPYTFVPELRGNGFDVSPSLIPLSFDEMWNGLVAMMDEIMAQNP